MLARGFMPRTEFAIGLWKATMVGPALLLGGPGARRLSPATLSSVDHPQEFWTVWHLRSLAMNHAVEKMTRAFYGTSRLHSSASRS
jgi:hypothetical protein